MQHKVSPTSSSSSSSTTTITTTNSKTSPQLNKSNEITTSIKTDPFDRSTPINKNDDHNNEISQQQQIFYGAENTNLTAYSYPYTQCQSFNDFNNLQFTNATNVAAYQNMYDQYQNQQKPSNICWRPTQPSSADYIQNSSNYITMNTNVDNGAKYYGHSTYNDYSRAGLPITNSLFSPISTPNNVTSSQLDNCFNFMLKPTTNDVVKLEDHQPTPLISQLQAPALNTNYNDFRNATTNLLYQFNAPTQQVQQQRISPNSSNSLSSSTTSPPIYQPDLKHAFNYISSPTSSLNLLASTCQSSASSNTNRSCSDTNSEQLNDTQANITPINSSGSSSSPSGTSETNNDTVMKNQSMGNSNTFDWMKPVKNPSNGKSPFFCCFKIASSHKNKFGMNMIHLLFVPSTCK